MIDLLKFYKNEAKNNRGVALEDIWSYSDVQLERKHNYVQWLFPTDDKSSFNWSSPVLSREDVEMLRNDEAAMRNFRKSLEIMMKFYGFELSDNSVVFADDFETKAKNWITPNNHNYKCISRILRFLTIFEFCDIKKSFVEILDGVYEKFGERIGEKSYRIWKIV